MKFYILLFAGQLRFGTQWSYFDVLSSVVDRTDYEWCVSCGRSVSRTRELPPLKIKLSSGKPQKWGDFAWGAFFTPLVSDEFRHLYEREKMTGIKFFYPTAEIVRVGTRKTGDFPADLPTYYFIEILWGGANQDDDASGVVRKTVLNSDASDYCSYCHQGGGEIMRQRGVFIEPSSWTGVDIFEARGGPPYPMVSEKFKQVVENSDLKNYHFVPIENFAYDIHNTKGWHIRT